jgi:hypothetical protein
LTADFAGGSFTRVPAGRLAGALRGLSAHVLFGARRMTLMRGTK